MRWDVCSGERYERDGEQKTHWTKVGFASEKDGKISIKIAEGLSVTGWLQLFPQEQKQAGAPRTQTRQAPAPQKSQRAADIDDEIPF